MPADKPRLIEAVRRELRDLLELFVIPGGAALLPWPLGFRLLRFLSRRSWPYWGLGDDALVSVGDLDPPADPERWKADYRLTQIIEHADFWLSRFRSDRWLKRYLDMEGAWPNRGPFIALGFVWGNAGYWCLRQLGCAGFSRALVYRPIEPEERRHGVLRYYYLRARMKHFHRAAGGAGIPTGGAWERIRELGNQGYAIVVVADAPPDPRRSTIAVRLLGQPARFRAGVLRLAAESGMPVVNYSVALDRNTGRRTLKVSAPLDVRSAETLATAAARCLDALLRQDAPAWFYWCGAENFFETGAGQ